MFYFFFSINIEEIGFNVNDTKWRQMLIEKPAKIVQLIKDYRHRRLTKNEFPIFVGHARLK